MTRIAAAALTAAFLPLTLSSCTDSPTARGSFSVRDSAGITIVENVGSGWGPEEAWRVDSQPSVEVGAFGGDTLYELYRVRGVERLANGTLVVANAGTHQLRFYDAQGRFLRSVGREGGGPGEFRQIWALTRLPGDTLAVGDLGHRKTFLFDSAGTLLRDVQPQIPGRSFPLTLTGGFEGGTLVSMVGPVYSTRDARRGHARDSVALVRLERTGELRDTLVVLSGSEMFVDREERYMRLRPAPFQRRSEFALAPDGAWVGATDRFELLRVDTAGRIVRIVRLEREPVPVTPDDAARWREGLLEGVDDPEELRRAEAAAAEMQMPGHKPAWADLRVDGLGYLWVKEYTPAWEQGERATWLIFDPEGRLLGRVDMPEDAALHEIGEDYVLTRAQDDLDVEYVRVYRLHRASGSD